MRKKTDIDSLRTAPAGALSWSQWRRRARTTGPAVNQPLRDRGGRFVARPKPVEPRLGVAGPETRDEGLANLRASIRRLERDEQERASDFAVTLGRIERMLADERQRHARDKEELARLIRHIVGIKRHLGLIEIDVPRPSRQRPFG